MATTIGKITEQAKRLIKGGNPSAGSNIWSEEIAEYIGQCVNKFLKAEQFSINLPSGETVPAGLMLASYDNIETERYKNTSRAKLPAIPISLPRQMGVYYVGPAGDRDCEFIPMQPGQRRMLGTQAFINELIAFSYEVEDGYVVFNKPFEKPVDIQLVVMDISKYGEYDLLPISADMEKDVVDMVVARFSAEPRPDKVEDSGSEPTKQQAR